MKMLRAPRRWPALLVLTAWMLQACAFPALAANLSLNDCVKLALEHNAQLRIASEQFLSAQGEALRLHAVLYPTVNAQALTAPTVVYVQINQVLYNRSTFPQLRISRLAQDQAVINYRQKVTDLVFQVRQAFAFALGARKGDDLLHSYIARQAGSLTSAQQLFDAGKIQKSEVLGVQVAQNGLAQQQEGTQLGVSQGFIALDNLLGVSLPTDTRLVGNLEQEIPADLDPARLTALALRDRADLKLLESLRLTQQQQIIVDAKNAFPTIGASSNSALVPPTLGGITDFDLERNYDEPEVQRQAGNSQLPLSLYLTWLVFDGGTMAGQGASDRAQLESQEVAIASLRRSIPGEVAAAVSAIRTERDTLRTLDATASSGDLRQTGDLDYGAGRIRKLDQINLESELLANEQTRLGARIRLSLALAALDHALGHGLLTIPAAAPTPHP